MDSRRPMAEPTEPQKETVRITLPPGTGATGARSAPQAGDTANGPVPPPMNPPAVGALRPSLAKSPIPPPPPPSAKSGAPLLQLVGVAPSQPAGAVSAASGVASPVTTPPPASPRKETARITVLPDPPSKSSVQMKKTQPLIDLPPTTAPEAPVTVAPETRGIVDVIPKFLCWALVAISALTLLIQIWNYLS